MNINTAYLIDDDPLNLEQLVNRSNLFMECGFEIAGSETDPRKALEDIRAIKPNAVLSDLKMPVMSGIDLWDELRSDEKPPVFVIISAYSEAEDIRKIFKTQGFDYLVKPVSDEELVELLVEINKRLNKNPPILEAKTESEELNQILTFINEYPAMSHTIESAAKRFGIAPRAVFRLFSKHLNTTFITYLTKLRMEKAEELLRSTDMRVKQIAAQCGFPDQMYFARVFKREHGGKSPSDYRDGMK